MDDVTFDVPDIRCEGCAGSIRRVLAKRAGVAAVDVDVDRRLVRVSYDAAAVGALELSKALAAAGFPPESVE
ncbi:MAG TPA: heavy-metal-associated domain-containing protein [Chthonomonadales bacterium]|nr:heavy-metal-associated domain-containing protein [Chthonomonadales bacterium]